MLYNAQHAATAKRATYKEAMTQKGATAVRHTAVHHRSKNHQYRAVTAAAAAIRALRSAEVRHEVQVSRVAVHAEVAEVAAAVVHAEAAADKPKDNKRERFKEKDIPKTLSL